MSFPRYGAYKDSGVEWLGEVPEHWTISKFGFLKTVLTDYTANGSFADLKKNVQYLDAPGYARLVRLTDLRKGLNNDDGVWINNAAYQYLSKSALYGGEFLLANVGAYAGLFYQMPYHAGPASLAPNMFMAKFNPSKVLPKFISLVAVSKSTCEQLKLLATSSSAQPKLNKDDFKSVIVAVPPLTEQTQITDFLDRETTRIDTLIAEQQRLIELLKEKRQAVISHAVTQGLDPTVPMKDSGVEWLGEVPAHWNIKKLKHFGRVIGGFAFKSQDFCDEGYPVIKISNVGHLNLEWDDTSFVPRSFSSLYSEYIAPQGALLFAMTRPVIAGGIKIARLDQEQYPLINQRVGFMAIKDESFSRFLLICSQSESFLSQFRNNLTITNQPNISSEGIESIGVAIPPQNELSEILKYLERLHSEFKDLIAGVERGIILLQERRSALISAAVTGKIDLRDWQDSAPAPEASHD